mgnify:CR=1 FL=1
MLTKATQKVSRASARFFSHEKAKPPTFKSHSTKVINKDYSEQKQERNEYREQTNNNKDW